MKFSTVIATVFFATVASADTVEEDDLHVGMYKCEEGTGLRILGCPKYKNGDGANSELPDWKQDLKQDMVYLQDGANSELPDMLKVYRECGSPGNERCKSYAVCLGGVSSIPQALSAWQHLPGHVKFAMITCANEYNSGANSIGAGAVLL